jgi:RNA polymerase sigma-70 factor (ECF subfamily)
MQSDAASTQSDSSLLQSWCERQSESAFAELVRRYERLVAGAALRRAGDVELARDVSQQVFSMLASKAHLLVGRGTIAGWLYRAASHVAAEWQRADLRRKARHTARATAEHIADVPDDRWPLLDEALSQLSASDREALLLHYFQDLSYSEMALQLGIGETAARKRVSRGVRISGRGFGNTAFVRLSRSWRALSRCRRRTRHRPPSPQARSGALQRLLFHSSSTPSCLICRSKSPFVQPSLHSCHLVTSGRPMPLSARN